MVRTVVDVTYRLKLVVTGEYIKETSDDRIWIKTSNRNEAFESGNLDYIERLGETIAKQKNLVWNKQLRIECTMIEETTWLV